MLIIWDFGSKSSKKREPGTKFKWNEELGKNCKEKANSWEENQRAQILIDKFLETWDFGTNHFRKRKSQQKNLV